MAPAIIPCWIKKLNSSQLPADHRHNPALALLITNYERMDFFMTMPQSFDDLYNITDFRYVNTSDTDYHIGFEYSMYMFDQSMDRTVAICGIWYYVNGTNRQCLATTFTLIRYNSTVPTSMELPTITTAETTPTPTTIVTTPGPVVITTTERCNTDGTDTPSTTPLIPPETTTPVLPTGTVTSRASRSLVTGLSLSTSILVLMVVILVLVVAILWVKLHTVSADLRVQKATCNTRSKSNQSEIRINEAVSDSEGERNENSSSDTKL